MGRKKKQNSLKKQQKSASSRGNDTPNCPDVKQPPPEDSLIQDIERLCNDDLLWKSTPHAALVALQDLTDCLSQVQTSDSPTSQQPLLGGNPVPLAANAGEPLKAENAASWAAFWAWMAMHGGSDVHQHIDIAWVDKSHGNGVMAVHDIPRGEVVMKIPSRILLSLGLGEGAVTPVRGLVASDPLLQHNETLALALLLIFEHLRGETSFFAPYLAHLPTTFSTPLFWTHEELAWLDVSPQVYLKTVTGWRVLAKQYCYVLHLIREKKGVIDSEQFSWRLFRWAMAAVITRQNHIPCADTNQAVLALIPCWDMCNHAEGDYTTSFSVSTEENEEEDGSERGRGGGSGNTTTTTTTTKQSVSGGGGGGGNVECRAMVDLKSGDPVHIYYGPRPNSDFLLYSGFVQPGNPRDGAYLPLPLLGSDPLMKVKLMLCNKLLLAKNKNAVKLDSTTASAPEGGTMVWVQLGWGARERTLTEALRIICLDKQGCSVLLRRDQEDEDSFTSEANDVAAASLLRAVCEGQNRAIRSRLAEMDQLTLDGGGGLSPSSPLSKGGLSPSSPLSKGGLSPSSPLSKDDNDHAGGQTVGIARCFLEESMRLFDHGVLLSSQWGSS